MNRLRNRLVAENENEVIATFAASFLEKQEAEMKKLSKANGITYTNLLSASRNGVGIKKLQPVFNKCVNEAMMEAASISVTEGNNYKQESMKRYLQTYMQVA